MQNDATLIYNNADDIGTINTSTHKVRNNAALIYDNADAIGIINTSTHKVHIGVDST